MILVHRLDGSAFYLNDDQIELIEANPDTVVTLSSQRKYVVREPVADLVEAIVAYRRRIFAAGPHLIDR
ncbi:MAG: flagellar protein [Chloroflexi bacterium]|nr:flagellar protein [Chloroflexota bacterium]